MLDFERWDSGLTNYAVSAASGLAERGHRVVFTGIKDAPPVKQAREKKLETVTFGNRTDLFGLARLIDMRNIQIVNSHEGSSHFLCFLLKLTREKKIKLFRTYSNAMPVRKHALLWKYTDKFIVPAEFIRKNFLNKGLSPEKVTVVYQGIGIADFSGGMKKKSESIGGCRVVIIGRLDPVKGHVHFLKAAAIVSEKFPETLFSVIGEEKNVKINELEKESKKLGLKNVKFQGYVEEISSCMRASDIGVIASVGSEAVSRTALEWMASGVPVVATDVGCLPEMIEDGKTGIVVPPVDPNVMAKVLCGLLGDGRLRRDMGRAAFERVKKNFSYKHFITETEKVFMEAL